MDTRRLTVTVTDEDGTVLDSGQVTVQIAEGDTGPTLAARAISEANWFMETGIGWPGLQ